MNSPILPLYKISDTVLIKSKACIVQDLNNKQYIDFESGDWASNLGHSHEKINIALKKQADLLIHDGLKFRNQPMEELAFKLLEKLSFTNGKSVFLNSGSEAVNLGIILAKNITKRTKILKMDCSYLACYGVGQSSPLNADLISIPIDDMDSISKINFAEIAAFVFEPGNSSGLIRFPSNNFIDSLAAEIKKNNGLLIANEVTTGFGRTGKWFGYQHYYYAPDIVCMGKALGNGYPVSCVCVTQEVAELFDKSPFRYAQSHQNDPLGCAVGIEVVKVFENENIVGQAIGKGEYFKDQLSRLQKKYPETIKDIRGRGLMIALEFVQNTNVVAINTQLLEKGFIVGQRDQVLRFMPPLIIDKKYLDQLVATLDEIISLSVE